jgi:hypothetical protein
LHIPALVIEDGDAKAAREAFFEGEGRVKPVERRRKKP